MQKYDSDFYVYMLSNGSLELFQDNNPSSFRNELVPPVDFSGEVDRWEVGVAELQIPSRFFNVTDGANTFSVRYPRVDTVSNRLNPAPQQQASGGRGGGGDISDRKPRSPQLTGLEPSRRRRPPSTRQPPPPPSSSTEQQPPPTPPSTWLEPETKAPPPLSSSSTPVAGAPPSGGGSINSSGSKDVKKSESLPNAPAFPPPPPPRPPEPTTYVDTFTVPAGHYRTSC
jgi:hypothetical protein